MGDMGRYCRDAMAKLPHLEWGERSGSGESDDTALWPNSLLLGAGFRQIPGRGRAGMPRVGATGQALRRLLRQNQRSATTTVSPGFICVMTGTIWRATTPSTGRLNSAVGRNARGVNPPAIATAVSIVMLGT